MPALTLQSSLIVSVPRAAQPEKGQHYDLIKNQMPSWIANADLHRVHPLKDLALHTPAWHSTASQFEHDTLKELNAHAWAAQTLVDRQLRNLQDVYAFAEPLLKHAIKEMYGLELDVKTTFLRIYSPAKLPWYALDASNGVTSREVSLLDAALHNFARGEAFSSDSCYITQPDYRGHFTLLHHEHTMSLEQFKDLCRRLNVGLLYQQHLNNSLVSTGPLAQALLKTQVIASQKAAFKAAAYMARIKDDLGAAAYAVVTGVLAGTEERAQFYQLNILGTPITGILVISSDLDSASSAAKVIAYIPHDPISPVKEYDSSAEFERDLGRKLQLNAALPSSKQVPPHTYQQFFSQFIPHSQRGRFFATLTERLYKVKWHERGPLDPAPSWCEEATAVPHLAFIPTRIGGNVWEQRYQADLNKILNDGSNIAVSTAHADSNARRAWWDNALKIFSDLFNVALLIVTPFVPVLGELMLAYTCYQLADEVIESLVDFSEGQASEAAQHVIGVFTDVLQLAALGFGGVLAKEFLFKPSPFVDSLKAVQVEGKPRLWNPDVTPYARKNLVLPSDAKPDALGLHEYQQKNVLRLDDQHYIVEHDPQTNTHRIKHPTRPEAYSPVVEHTRSGAWVHEGEDPWTWDDTQLRSRLGPDTQGLSPGEVEQACAISGTHEGALRKMYLDLEPTPPLLADSLKRIKRYQEAEQLPEKIRAGKPVDEEFNWSAQLTTERKGWPTHKAIEVVDGNAAGMVFGAAHATEPHTLKISLQDVEAGKLSEQLVTFLSDTELQALLPPPLPETQAARIDALRNQLADELTQDKVATFNHLYSTGEILDTGPARLLQKEFPQLPADLVQRLMLRTSPREVLVMNAEQRIPLRLKNLARELQNETIASHAFEGFYNDALLTADTERMALNTLRLYTDALGELHITVRDQTPAGPVRCQVGRQDALARKILLRKANGLYEVYDPQVQTAQPQYDFFEALLRTLPDEKIDYAPGQGWALKRWLQEKLELPAERRTALEPSTLRQVDTRETLILLQKPLFGAFRRLFRGETPTAPTLEQRMRILCPVLSDAQAQGLLTHLESDAGKHALSRLETEKRGLIQALDRWKKSPTLGEPNSMRSADETLMRGHIVSELKSNWENAAPGRITDTATNLDSHLLDLSELTLGSYIRSLELPTGCFDHITHLDLGDTLLHSEDTVFLKYFPNVRQLDLGDNLLSSVPSELTAMPRLERLSLRHTGIEWSLSDYQALAQCPQLRDLDLRENTALLTPPDLSSLPNLEGLNMRGTGIRQWPAGLNTPRASLPELNMINTQVDSVPEYPQGSQAAQTIARSWLDRSKLTPADEDKFVAYRRDAGFDPYRTAPAEGPAASEFWLSNLSEQGRAEAQRMWSELEHEHGSQGFFDVIKLLLPPEQVQTEFDAQHYRQGTRDLISRVQDLLIAVDRDASLRDRMFSLAGEPTHCADAAATTFNRMGVEVLEANILADKTPEGLANRETRLIKLARQKSRLERLNEIIRAEVRRRTASKNDGGLAQAFGSNLNEVDEVEVYLAYQTDLKLRLDLPWLSEFMVYRNTANVSDEQINIAHRQIINQEYGNGLVDSILKQDFWNEHLETTYRSQFDARREQRDKATGHVVDLLAAHERWADPEVTAEEKMDAVSQMRELAGTLNIRLEDLLGNQSLSFDLQNRFYERVQRDYQQLGRRLTHAALSKIGL